MAQFGSASGLGPEGRRFESCLKQPIFWLATCIIISMQKYFIFFFLLLIATLSCGCTHLNKQQDRVDIISLCIKAGHHLSKQLDTTTVKKTPIYLTTFADLDNLTLSNSLGRLLPHQIGSALRDYEYFPVDIRLRSDDILVQQKNGEFILSRDINVLEPEYRSALFLVGTYSHIRDLIYVNAKVVSAVDGVVLASTDFEVPEIYGKNPEDDNKKKEPESKLRLVPSTRTRLVDPVNEKPLPE